MRSSWQFKIKHFENGYTRLRLADPPQGERRKVPPDIEYGNRTQAFAPISMTTLRRKFANDSPEWDWLRSHGHKRPPGTRSKATAEKQGLKQYSFYRTPEGAIAMDELVERRGMPLAALLNRLAIEANEADKAAGK